MKTCRNCGRTIGDWKFCSFCGTKLDEMDLSYQKTNSLLRQNIILSNDIRHEESFNSPRRVSADYVEANTPNDADKSMDTDVVVSHSLASEQAEENNSVIDEKMIDSLSEDSSYEYGEIINQSFSDSMHPESENTEEKIVAHDSDEMLMDDSIQEELLLSNTDHPEIVQNTLFDDPSMNEAGDLQNTDIDDESSLIENNELIDTVDSKPESPFNLGSLFRFEHPQLNDTDREESCFNPSTKSDDAQDDSTTQSDLFGIGNDRDNNESITEGHIIDDSSNGAVESSEPNNDDSGIGMDSLTVSETEELLINNDLTEPVNDTSDESINTEENETEAECADTKSAAQCDNAQSEENIQAGEAYSLDESNDISENDIDTDLIEFNESDKGFSAIDFDSIDAENDHNSPSVTNITNDIDLPVPDEIQETSIDRGSLNAETDPSRLRQEFKQEEQKEQAADTLNKSASHIAATEIDPMFGAAPTFDIESIKASYQSTEIKEKKPKKGFFSRKKK